MNYEGHGAGRVFFQGRTNQKKKGVSTVGFLNFESGEKEGEEGRQMSEGQREAVQDGGESNGILGLSAEHFGAKRRSNH